VKATCLSLFLQQRFSVQNPLIYKVKMNHISVGEAFSAGIGLAFGLAMAQYTFSLMKPSERIRQVVVCLKCGSTNPIENKFCCQCGQPIYPPPSIKCAKCGTQMPSNWNFCGMCGASLRKKAKTRKRRERKI